MSTTIYVLSRNIINIRFFYLKIFIFFGGKIFYIFEKACFRNVLQFPFVLLFLFS